MIITYLVRRHFGTFFTYSNASISTRLAIHQVSLDHGKVLTFGAQTIVDYIINYVSVGRQVSNQCNCCVIGDGTLNMIYVYSGPLATETIKRLQPTS
jgi:hypothetical protein